MNRRRMPVVAVIGALLAMSVAGPALGVEPHGDGHRDRTNRHVPPGPRLAPSERISGSPGSQTFAGANGKIVYSHAPFNEWPGSIWVMDSNGANQTLLVAGGIGIGDNSPSWSPGGTMIAFSRDMTSSIDDDADDIFRMQANGTGVTRLTSTSAAEYGPTWSPDGARLAFTSNRSGNYEIYSMAIDGSDVRRLTTNSGVDANPSWSPDGAKIAFASDRTGNLEIYTMNADGSSVVRIVTNAAADWSPTWSPDGMKVAFTSDRTGVGVGDIFVMNANGTSVVNITNDPVSDDARPAWSPDGTMISFEGDPAVDFDVFGISSTGGTSFGLAATLDDEWNPDWQPIPAFPLVDAKFSPFNSYIVWVFNKGITTGCSTERYCPEASVTRGQMASFLARALNLSGAAPDAFTDDETSVHEVNINLVAREGIASGCGGTNFCPNGLVSREQMASFLARALSLSGAAPDAFTDDETSIHEVNINLVAREGIATGCGGTNYCPTANVTRGQMAAFLHRAFAP